MSYKLDDKQGARDVVRFYLHDSASTVETALIKAYANGDMEIKARLRREFPALADAWDAYMRGDGIPTEGQVARRARDLIQHEEQHG